jgi:hypothetical protein
MKTKAELTAELAANITDALNGQNTAAKVREIIQDIIDSSVNSLDNGGIVLLAKFTAFDFNSGTPVLATLSGGTKFVITDMLVTNVSGAITAANGLRLYSGASKTGDLLAQSDSNVFNNPLLDLDTADNFISTITNQGGNGFITIPSTTKKVQTPFSVYASVENTEGSPLTGDIYVYGYNLP